MFVAVLNLSTPLNLLSDEKGEDPTNPLRRLLLRSWSKREAQKCPPPGDLPSDT